MNYTIERAYRALGWARREANNKRLNKHAPGSSFSQGYACGFFNAICPLDDRIAEQSIRNEMNYLLRYCNEGAK